MLYLKQFETEQEYNSYVGSDSLILPNVSFITESSTGGIKFNPKPEEPAPTIILRGYLPASIAEEFEALSEEDRQKYGLFIPHWVKSPIDESDIMGVNLNDSCVSFKVNGEETLSIEGVDFEGIEIYPKIIEINDSGVPIFSRDSFIDEKFERVIVSWDSLLEEEFLYLGICVELDNEAYTLMFPLQLIADDPSVLNNYFLYSPGLIEFNVIGFRNELTSSLSLLSNEFNLTVFISRYESTGDADNDSEFINQANSFNTRVQPTATYRVSSGNTIPWPEGEYEIKIQFNPEKTPPYLSCLLEKNLWEELTIIGGFSNYYAPYFNSLSSSYDSSSLFTSGSLYGGSRLKRITLSDKLLEVSPESFYDCNSLEYLSISGGGKSPNYDSRNNCNAIIETETNILVLGCSSTIIPNGITEIGEYSFANKNVIELKFPESVVLLWGSCFEGCHKLVYLDFSDHKIIPEIFDGNEIFLTSKNKQIIVPLDLYETWKKHPHWSKYENIIVTEKKPIPIIHPNSNNHEYVDLGLPSGLKWAKCNVGAEKESDYGLYFQWGETVGYKDASSGKIFDWSNYKYCNGSKTTLTKYNTFSSFGTVDNKTTLESSDDAATVNMGGSWRMPTKKEYEELIDNTTSTWTTVDGVYGRLFTSKTNRNTLFLPASGYCSMTGINTVGSYGHYWSSSLYSSSPDYACHLYFRSDYRNVVDYNRDQGYAVRGVVE